MWIWFNKYGVLKQSITHGEKARVGSTTFQIFAYFKDLSDNEDIDINTATIRFQRPDLKQSEYPLLFMNKVTLPYETIEGDGITLFQNNQSYPGFLFDFGDFVENEDVVKLLDTPGLWEASITLYTMDSRQNVTGLITFDVEEAVSEADDEETELDSSIIISNIATQLAKKVPYLDTGYIKAVANIAEIEEFNENKFVIGDIVFDKATLNTYKITSLNPAAYINLTIPSFLGSETLLEIGTVYTHKPFYFKYQGQFWLGAIKLLTTPAVAEFNFINLEDNSIYNGNIGSSTVLSSVIVNQYKKDFQIQNGYSYMSLATYYDFYGARPCILKINNNYYTSQVVYDSLSSSYTFEFENLINSERYAGTAANITLGEVFTSTYAKSYALEESAVLIYESSGSTLYQLYTDCSKNGLKPFILRRFGYPYLGFVNYVGHDNLYYFEFEQIGTAKRYIGQADGETYINNVLGSSSTYESDYALEEDLDNYYNKTETDANFLKIIDATSSTQLTELTGNPKIFKISGGYYIAKIIAQRIIITNIYIYYFEIENLIDKTRYAGSIEFASAGLTLGDVMTDTYKKNYIDLSHYTDDNKNYIVTINNNTPNKVLNPFSWSGENLIIEVQDGYIELIADGISFYISSNGLEWDDEYVITSGDIYYYVANWDANNLVCTYSGSAGAYYYYYQFQANSVYKLELYVNRDNTTRYVLGIVQIESLSNKYILTCDNFKAEITPNLNKIRIFENGVEFSDEDYTEDCGVFVQKLK